MLIEKVNDSDRTKLQMALEKYTNSFSKRNVAFVCTAHAGTVANVIMFVTGKRGTVQKDLVIIFDKETEDWICYSEGVSYQMGSLSDISILIKNKIQKLSTILTKI